MILQRDLLTPGYSAPLSVEFLKAHAFLLLDTRFFDFKFVNNLLASFEQLDEQCDGILIQSENFHALRLVSEIFIGKISNIFIDPPYNTGDDEFVYKDGYKSSSWLSMLYERVNAGINLLSSDGVFFVSIGDEEQEHLATMLRQQYGKEHFFATLIWEKKKKGSFLSGQIASMKDYILCVSKQTDAFRGLVGEIVSDVETYPCVNASNPREVRIIQPGISSKFREKNYRLSAGEVITAGNMNLVLKSDLVIENGLLSKELIIEGNWRYSQNSMDEYAARQELYITQDLYLRRIVSEPRYKRMKDLLPRTGEEGESDFRAYDITNLSKYGWGTNEDANDELHQIMGEQYAVSYPKPSKLLTLLLVASRHKEGYWLDYFAGSGTTAHAVINLNRADGGSRKYIVVEMGNYFSTVLKPRIQKVIYSKDWKDGKPVSREGLSHCFKYIRLESYEDTLNNLALRRKAEQQLALEQSPAFGESYMLSYMLDAESQGSLLSIESFRHPFSYQLNIATGAVGESKPATIDLVETFNYLVGLRVQTMQSIRGFRVVTGFTPEGERTLIIWRDLDEKDNASLEEFFRKQDYNPRDMEFDLIYVNGDNNLENLRRPDETWKVRLIEEEFLRRMFDTEGM